jgi:lipopolysaccharide exporter
MRIKDKAATIPSREFGSFGYRVLSASAWVLGLQLFNKVAGAVQLLVLSRILAPHDFGLIAIATITIAAFDVLTRTGFDDALIQKRGDIEAYVHTAFGIQIMRGALLAALIFLTAPYVGNFFEEPQAIPVIAMLALVQLLGGMRSPGLTLLQRDLNFRIQSLCLASGDAIRIVITIVLAFEMRSVWAIVIGAIIGEVSIVVFSYLVNSYRPKLVFSFEKAKELVRYGFWLFLSGIVGYLSLQADKVAVGKLLNADELGIYYMAYRIANLITIEVVTSFGKALKPAYAALQSDPERLRIAFEKSLSVVTAFILPTGIFLILTADLIVPVLLGAKWNAIIPILPIFVLGAIFYGIEGISFAFFIGTGSPHKDFYLALTKAISLMACIYPFFLLAGLKGIAWAVTMSTISRFFVFVIQLFPLIDIRQFVIHELFLVSFCTAIMGIALFVEAAFMPIQRYSYMQYRYGYALIKDLI